MLRCLTLVAACSAASAAFAQAPCCTQPTVAYSPVVAAPAPTTVVQSTVVNDRWYPGKYLTDFTRNLFGANPTTTTTTYAPAPYAPTPYVANYAPAPYYAQRTVYRPTYPATYGPVMQTVTRPVVLSPVVATNACDACSVCSASPVQPAYYGEATGGCSSCAGGSSFPSSVDYYSDSAPAGSNPPSLDPSDDVPSQRLRPTPADDDMIDDDFGTEPNNNVEQSSANDYFTPPPLFAPPSNNNVARRLHPAPVRKAVYREPIGRQTTALRPATHAAAKPRTVQRLSASGWASASE